MFIAINEDGKKRNGYAGDKLQHKLFVVFLAKMWSDTLARRILGF
jgi:hypothetical protein